MAAASVFTSPVATLSTDIVLYDGRNYMDIGDDIKQQFGLKFTPGTNERAWKYVWDRRELLYDAVQAAIAEKDELRRTQGKKVFVTRVIDKQIQMENNDANDKANSANNFVKLVDEVHYYFALLKKTSDEVNALKMSQPNSDQATIAAQQMHHRQRVHQVKRIFQWQIYRDHHLKPHYL